MVNHSPLPGCEVCEIMPQIDPDFVLYDGQYWNANLRDADQTLLGTTFITATQHVSELDKLTKSEESELLVVRNGLFRSLRAAFAPKTFNISCLKNDAFRENPDATSADAAHVHWHVKPRYGTQPIVVNGETFTDPMPGLYLSQYERHVPSRETALIIARQIRVELAGNLSRYQ